MTLTTDYLTMIYKGDCACAILRTALLAFTLTCTSNKHLTLSREILTVTDLMQNNSSSIAREPALLAARRAAEGGAGSSVMHDAGQTGCCHLPAAAAGSRGQAGPARLAQARGSQVPGNFGALPVKARIRARTA